MRIISTLGASYGDQPARALNTNDFPLEELARHPVSAIEPVAVKTAGQPRGVCAVGCLACCAAAAPISLPSESMARLTPELLGGVLEIAEGLAKDDLHIFSTVRLALHNGSNELDNPVCIDLRRVLSAFFERTYGRPLGSLSSDLAFHVSQSPALAPNLSKLLEIPLLWDNIALSLDEQMPWRNEEEYRGYLDRLANVWAILKPALTLQTVHAIKAKQNSPRVILNLLIPEDGSAFRPEHQSLYPGGPNRAVRFDELVDRYIRPFVGRLVDQALGGPEGHKFTSGSATLSGVPGSSVFVGYNRYMQTGRGGVLIRGGSGVRKAQPRAIITKMYPAGENRIRFKACFTTVSFADDEIAVPWKDQPLWIRQLNNIAFEVRPVS